MAKTNPVQTWLKQSRKSWAVLAQASAWVLALVGGFLLPPPTGGWGEADKTWLRFGQFFVAVLVGLIFVPVWKWKQKKHALGWWEAAMVSLVLATGGFFTYQSLTVRWTGYFFEDKVLLGSEYTDVGRTYVEKHPNLPVHLLLEDFLGRADDIWTHESITRRRLILSGLYLGCLPLLAVCLISVVQASQCLSSTPPKTHAH